MDSIPSEFTILASIIGCGLGWAWWKWARCPSALQHLPCIPTLHNLYCQFTGVGFDDRYEITGRAIHSKHKLTREWQPPLGWCVHVNDMTGFKFMSDQHTIFSKVLLNDVLRGTLAHQWLGYNVLFSNGAEWHFFRKTATPAFKVQWDLTKIVGTSETLLNIWSRKEGEVIDLMHWIPRYTLDTLGQIIFTHDFGGLTQEHSPFGRLHSSIMSEVLKMRYFFFTFADRPWNPWRRKTFQDIEEFDQRFSAIINDRRAKQARGEPIPRDLLGSFLEGQKITNESGEKGVRVMTDREMRDNMNIFFMAGHDTGTTTISRLIYLLGQKLDVQDKVRSCVLEALANDDDIPRASHDIPFLDAVIKEFLRLYPATGRLPERLTTEDVVMPCGQFLPKGTCVIGNMWAVNRDPKTFGEDAEVFRPERQLSPGPNGKQVPLTTFGLGPRSCIGQRLALAEIRIILMMLVRAFTWVSIENSTGKPVLGVPYLIHPKHIKIVVTRREQAAA
ncbi:cytochrome P450 [Piptocephalis cylindrospora]|uniref:Cytochrome P450 n=1 Tax=Piptocephalis cylindrospora TaxID=1907219 RepID=A0A4P9Y7W4_9FUNG|nr:cytochrome P450 [Piptocephalis cylindrospora]|eukprot:RKP15246.1 cytochrome P450 [Piptocephalis cylindrospora]